MNPDKKKIPAKNYLLAIFAPLVIVGGGNLALHWPRPDPQGAMDILSKTTNLHDIKIAEKGPWAGCGGRGDFWRTRFNAVNDKGQKVEGTVCKGLAKSSSTIAYD